RGAGDGHRQRRPGLRFRGRAGHAAAGQQGRCDPGGPGGYQPGSLAGWTRGPDGGLPAAWTGTGRGHGGGGRQGGGARPALHAAGCGGPVLRGPRLLRTRPDRCAARAPGAAGAAQALHAGLVRRLARGPVRGAVLSLQQPSLKRRRARSIIEGIPMYRWIAMFAYAGLRTARFETPLGAMRLVADPQGALLRLDFEEDAVHGLAPSQLAGLVDDPSLAGPVRAQLEDYFEGRRQDFDLPLGLHGTEFQRQVWQALRTIPYGQTWTYGQMAEHLGRPKAMRAVGQACGLNPL